jgi:tetraacyldisaccharide 4'-kinase
MRNTVLKVWRGEAGYAKWLLYPLLYPLSLLYGSCLNLREYMYRNGKRRMKEVPIPVISVGNITLGGTGKTPVVERLSTRLKELGFRPGIATRGYKRKRKGTFIVDVENDTARDVGDEAFMLAKKTKLPVLVGADRAEAIEQGMKSFQIDVAILDDGFQTRSIKKDLEILVLSGREGKAGNRLFPLGPYREPPAGVKKADMILVNKGMLSDEIIRHTEEAPVHEIRYKPAYLYNIKRGLIAHYNYMKDTRVLAFSGLGDNESFFNLLGEIGADVVHEIPYPDHYAYKEGDVAKLSSFKDVEVIVTTEKDAVKIAAMNLPDNLFYLAIEVVIDGEEELLKRIIEKLKMRDAARIAYA